MRGHHSLHTSAPEGRITEFDHNDPSVPPDRVRQIYADMRESCPVAHSDRFGGLDYVSRYEDVRRILADNAMFHTTDGVFIPPRPSGLPNIPPLEYDPPEHTVLHALMGGPLNSCAVRAFEPTIAEIAHLLIDGFAGAGVADLASQLTEYLPVIVVGRVVGLTQDEAVEARRLSMAAFDSIGKSGPPMLTAFMNAQLEQRKTAAGDDYLTALAQGEVAVEPVDAELVTGIMLSFMLGGHSTATAIAGLFRHVCPTPRCANKSWPTTSC
jgi:cholest-4-en-3-one 26-monooxygenase